MTTLRKLKGPALVLVLALAPACAAAVGAAAGAAAAIAYNERNAESEVAGTVNQIADATGAVFSEMGIAQNHRHVAADGSDAEIRGNWGDMAVTVEIRRSSQTTSRVIVTAREGDIGYRPNRAGEVLQRIIDRRR